MGIGRFSRVEGGNGLLHATLVECDKESLKWIGQRPLNQGVYSLEAPKSLIGQAAERGTVANQPNGPSPQRA
ncbi:LOW QUALITY PROTEIN: hypothetical protein HJFPF1_03702 [Paramyrothecium foliicola]|nr:LOW QUALITY PROTEIN: hypothetical protein HJFPF1_03702 [Paramyrothecium foliicola]